MSGSKRRILTLKQRLEILKQLEEGATAQQISSCYNLQIDMVRKIKYNAMLLRGYVVQARSSDKKKMHRPLNEQLVRRLYSWFLGRRAAGDYITNGLLREKATNINKELGGQATFRAGDGWLSRFKMHYKITNINTEEDENDEAEILKFLEDFKNIMYEQDIHLDNLYNMHDTTLSWSFLRSGLPHMTLDYLNKTKIDGKFLKKFGFTVGFCSNASGSNKLPLLIINKQVSLRGVRDCKDSLPVVFKAQQTAHMNKKLFLDWYVNDFKTSVKKHQLENGKCGAVLLIVVGSKVHSLPPQILKDEGFNVLYLPLNTSSLIQPMSQGIIENTKYSFRHEMLQVLLHCPGGVRQFFIEYRLKHCYELLNETWASITPCSIKNAWNKLLLFLSNVNSAEQSNNRKLHETIRAIIDSNIACSEIEEWLSTCVETEEEIFEVEDNEEKEEEEGGSSQLPCKNDSFLDEENVETMFKQLILWAKNEPKHIRTQVQYLKNFHYKT